MTMKQSSGNRNCQRVAMIVSLLLLVSVSDAWVQPPMRRASTAGVVLRDDRFQLEKNSYNKCLSPFTLQRLPVSSNTGGRRGVSRTRHHMLAQIFAGSLAGAVGVGVSFPLDTLKVKQQVMQLEAPNIFQTISHVYEQEGIGGFFGGVRGMMLGQAVIKSVAFGCNAFGLNFLQQHNYGGLGPTTCLLLAAAFSGFMTSFLVVPVERIKVMMQAQQGGGDGYANELDCLRAILKSEGLGGLFGRGLGPTLAREVPSYAIYFCVYGLLMKTAMAASLGHGAPLVFGATAGCACWLPVYPIDCVKTVVQNTEGGADHAVTAWDVTRDLYQRGGVGAFFDGLTPKMLRAALNHAVTFWVYDSVLAALQVPVSIV